MNQIDWIVLTIGIIGWILTPTVHVAFGWFTCLAFGWFAGGYMRLYNTKQKGDSLE